MSDEEVAPGDTVLTSGGDQIFPKGLRVGTVSKVGTGKDLFLNVRIRPAANLSKLEEVLVVTEKQERQAAAQVTERMRAADILAQRLPSVPDKPATPEANAGGTAGNAATGTAGGASGALPPSKPLTVPNPQAGAATKTQSPSGSTKQGAGSIPPGTVTPSGSQAAGSSHTRSATVPGQTVSNGAPKTAPPRRASEPAAQTGNSQKTVGSKPADSPATSPETPKPALPQSNPQPPAADDSPN